MTKQTTTIQISEDTSTLIDLISKFGEVGTEINEWMQKVFGDNSTRSNDVSCKCRDLYGGLTEALNEIILENMEMNDFNSI